MLFFIHSAAFIFVMAFMTWEQYHVKFWAVELREFLLKGKLLTLSTEVYNSNELRMDLAMTLDLQDSEIDQWLVNSRFLSGRRASDPVVRRQLRARARARAESEAKAIIENEKDDEDGNSKSINGSNNGNGDKSTYSSRLRSGNPPRPGNLPHSGNILSSGNLLPSGNVLPSSSAPSFGSHFGSGDISGFKRRLDDNNSSDLNKRLVDNHLSGINERLGYAHSSAFIKPSDSNNSPNYNDRLRHGNNDDSGTSDKNPSIKDSPSNNL